MRMARPWSRVHTLEARPYSTPLAQSTACASSAKRCTVMAGPNISSWTISSPCSRPVTTVGAKQKPRAPTWRPAGDHLGVVGEPVEEPLEPRPAGRALLSGP